MLQLSSRGPYLPANVVFTTIIFLIIILKNQHTVDDQYGKVKFANE